MGVVIVPLRHAADGSWRSVVEAGVRRLVPDEAVLAPDVVRAGLALCPPLVRPLLALPPFFLHAGHVAKPLAVVAFAAAAAPAAAHRNRQQHGPDDHADGNHTALEGNEADAPVDLGEVGTLIMAWNESLVRVVATLPRSRAVVTPCARSQAVSAGRVGLHRTCCLRRDGRRGRFCCVRFSSRTKHYGDATGGHHKKQRPAHVAHFPMWSARTT